MRRGQPGRWNPSTKDTGLVEEHIYEQRLTLVDPRSGETKPITPADTYVYEYDWAPDSERLAYTAAKGNGDNNWWIAQLYTISAGFGRSPSDLQTGACRSRIRAGRPTGSRSLSSAAS